VPFNWMQLATDAQARADAGVEHLADSRLPVCVFADGARLECLTVRQLTEKLGWFRNPTRSEYDLAIHGASEGLKTVLIERYTIGGQAGSGSRIVCDAGGYLVTGPDLLRGRRCPAQWPLDREPYYLETSMTSLFAAGDIRHGSMKRCASAVGEGALAVALVHRYLAHG
jgi:hypothetical protein